MHNVRIYQIISDLFTQQRNCLAMASCHLRSLNLLLSSHRCIIVITRDLTHTRSNVLKHHCRGITKRNKASWSALALCHIRCASSGLCS